MDENKIKITADLSAPVECREKGYGLEAVRVPDYIVNPNDPRLGFPEIKGAGWLDFFINTNFDYEHIGISENDPDTFAIYHGEDEWSAIEAGNILVRDTNCADVGDITLQCVSEEYFREHYEINPEPKFKGAKNGQRN